MSALPGRIILERKSQYLNRLKSYRVLINGKEQEKKISNGSSEEFETTDGTNVITCKVNWCSSNDFSFDVKPGETVYLKVASGMKYFWVVYGIFIVTVVARLLFKVQMNPPLSIAASGIVIAGMLYFLYYLTLGRNQYLKIEKDADNIFAK